MILSEVLAKLQQLYEEHGDIEVECWGYDGQDCPGSAKDISVYEAADGRNMSVPQYKSLSTGQTIKTGYKLEYVTEGPPKKRAVIE